MVAMARQIAALNRLHSEFGFRDAELAQGLGTSEPTLQLWRRGTGGESTPADLKRLDALAAFLAELDDLFADGQAAHNWLDKSLGVLQGRAPRQMIVDGHVERVTGLLCALNAGVHS
jgi:uncharacterized protein (DUF2384 family)